MSVPLSTVSELLSFLDNPNRLAVYEALKLIQQFSGEESFQNHFAQLNGEKRLISFCSDRSADLQEFSLRALLGLTDNEVFTRRLIACGFIQQIMEFLRDKENSHHALQLMILANLTRDDSGSAVLLQESDSKLVGLHVKRLLGWFFTQAEDYAHVAFILINITNRESGRRLLMDGGRDVLWQLRAQLALNVDVNYNQRKKRKSAALNSPPNNAGDVPVEYYNEDPNYIRKLGSLSTIRNLFLDSANHAALLSPELAIVEAIVALICGEGEIKDYEVDNVPAVFLNAMNSLHPRDCSREIRRLVCEILLLGLQFKPTRLRLKALHLYPIVRELHMYEKSIENGELDQFLYDVVPYLILDEDDKEKIKTANEKAKIEEIEENQGEGEAGGLNTQAKENREKLVIYLNELDDAKKKLEGAQQKAREEKEKADEEKAAGGPKLDLADTPENRKFDALLSVSPTPVPYRLRGRVVKGFNRGSKLLGCPTANLDPAAFEEKLVGVPRGVYCGFAQVNRGPVYKTVLSLGTNPQFSTVKETVEAYLLHDFPEDFYGEELTLIICGFLRTMEKFNGLAELINWIARDTRVSSRALELSEFKQFQQDKFFNKTVEEIEREAAARDAEDSEKPQRSFRAAEDEENTGKLTNKTAQIRIEDSESDEEVPDLLDSMS